MHGIKMVAYKGLFRRLTITCILFCMSVCRLCETSRSTRYYHLSVGNERFSSPYKTFEDASGLQCSTICTDEVECRAFNHNAATGSCELINLSGLQQQKQVTEDNSWAVYNTDYCLSTPCKNEGECLDTLDSYTCSCVYPWIGETCQITYVCYHWSSDDKQLMSAGASRLDVCEMVPGRKFTDGNNSLTPGCGTCSCCREVLA